MGLLDAPGLSRAQAGRKAAAAPQLRAVLFGDSITNNNGPGVVANTGETAIYNDSRGWFHWANSFLGRPFTMVKNAGLGGDTTSQMLARVGTDVLPYAGNGTWLFGLGGVNDKNDVAITTAISIANLKSIFTQAFAAGFERIVWGTISPDGNTLNGRAGFDAINDWLQAYAAVTPNFILVNWLEVFVDGAADGSPLPGYTIDGLHPSPLGAMKIGAYIADAITGLVPKTSRLPMRNQASGVWANPMLIGNVSGLATGFNKTGFAGGAYKMPRWDGRGGEWQVLVSTSNAAESNIYSDMFLSEGRFAAGDQVFSEFEFETEDDWTDCTVFSLELQAGGDATVTTGVYQVFDMLGRSQTTQFGGNPRRGVYRTPVLTVPAGVTLASTGKLRQILHFQGIGTLRVARFGTYKVVTP